MGTWQRMNIKVRSIFSLQETFHTCSQRGQVAAERVAPPFGYTHPGIQRQSAGHPEQAGPQSSMSRPQLQLSSASSSLPSQLQLSPGYTTDTLSRSNRMHMGSASSVHLLKRLRTHAHGEVLIMSFFFISAVFGSGRKALPERALH